MIEKIVESTIIRHRLIECGQQVAVAVSGGADSMVLLHVLHRLQLPCGFRLSALHYEHGIRGAQSEEDMRFVQETCAKLGIPLFVERGNALQIAQEQGKNLEDTARRLRYDFFARCCREQGIDRVAVAHHKDDLAETFLLHLIRGSGPQGLCAMPYLREDGIIRPLLDVSRKQIEAYAAEHGIAFRQDSTNEDLHYSRNFLRLQLLPQMRKLNPEVSDAIARAGRLLEEEQQLLTEYTLREYAAIAQEQQGRIILQIEELRLLPAAMRRRVLRMAVHRCTGTLQDVGSAAIEQLERLAEQGETGKIFSLPGIFFAQVNYGLLILSPKMYTIDKMEPMRIQPGENLLPDGGRLLIRPAERPNSFPPRQSLCQYIDAQKLPQNCMLRTRQEGDLFRPFGVQGSQKLKEWFIDRKIPREQREQQLLLCCGKEVLWIIGHSLSETLRVQPHTRHIYEVQYIRP